MAGGAVQPDATPVHHVVSAYVAGNGPGFRTVNVSMYDRACDGEPKFTAFTTVQ